MGSPLHFFIDSLQVKFLHIRTYELDYRWSFEGRQLARSVLWFVRSGQFDVKLDGAAVQGGTGDLLLLPAGSVLSSRAVSSKLTIVSINFDAGISFLTSRSWVEILQLPIRFPDMSAEAEPILHEMEAALVREDIGSGLLLQAGLLRLLSRLLGRKALMQPERSVTTMDSRVHAIIEYMTAHPSLLPEVGQLAELVHLSESHLRKLFLQHTGLSPIQFVHQLKVELARKELVSGDRRVSDIAFRLGFEDANYFARLFKDKTGHTPQQYRKQHRIFEM